jgi:hypothetical protein
VHTTRTYLYGIDVYNTIYQYFKSLYETYEQMMQHMCNCITGLFCLLRLIIKQIWKKRCLFSGFHSTQNNLSSPIHYFPLYFTTPFDHFRSFILKCIDYLHIKIIGNPYDKNLTKYPDQRQTKNATYVIHFEKIEQHIFVSISVLLPYNKLEFYCLI